MNNKDLCVNSVRGLKAAKGGNYELHVPVGITVTDDNGRAMGRWNQVGHCYQHQSHTFIWPSVFLPGR